MSSFNSGQKNVWSPTAQHALPSVLELHLLLEDQADLLVLGLQVLPTISVRFASDFIFQICWKILADYLCLMKTLVTSSDLNTFGPGSPTPLSPGAPCSPGKPW